MSNWHNVSTREPCPICGKTDWCSLSDDGYMCVCKRTPSNRPTPSGNGWIYRLGDAKPKYVRKLMNKKPDVDVQAYFEAIPHGNEQIRLSRYLMRELSLPADLFLLMDVRWDPKAKAAAFPMRNADGHITGIRYRDVKNGQKWSFKGGHDGLFYIPDYFSALDRELFVCEGPTDMLAAAACGIMNIVGRSSCNTGSKLIREMVRLVRADVLTIVADDDEPKTRPDGSTFRPGIDGAHALADSLDMTYRIMLPPPPKKKGKTCKDLRQWYSEFGMTKESFLAMATSAKWCVPKLGI